MKNPYDIVIIGAGIIGLATGMKLLEKHPKIKIAIIDKDSEVSTQQSGHNSGVVHSGIYYKPGSFKAKFCVEGRTSMSTFCEENEIPTWACGKLIVAISEEDKIIKPAIRILKRNKINVVGPLSADTLFMKQNIKNT